MKALIPVGYPEADALSVETARLEPAHLCQSSEFRPMARHGYRLKHVVPLFAVEVSGTGAALHHHGVHFIRAHRRGSRAGLRRRYESSLLG